MELNVHRRLRGFDYTTPGMYFVTFCTQGRVRALSRINEEGELRLSALGRTCMSAAKGLEARFDGVVLEDVVVMPDHVHALIGLGERSSHEHTDIPRIIRWWKRQVTVAARQRGWTGQLWQRSYHDRVVRGERDLAQIREYMANNPKRWALGQCGECPW